MVECMSAGGPVCSGLQLQRAHAALPRALPHAAPPLARVRQSPAEAETLSAGARATFPYGTRSFEIFS